MMLFSVIDYYDVFVTFTVKITDAQQLICTFVTEICE